MTPCQAQQTRVFAGGSGQEEPSASAGGVLSTDRSTDKQAATKMQTLLSRDAGPPFNAASSRNLAPATATSYLLTVMVPTYCEKLGVRLLRELRTVSAALDHIASISLRSRRSGRRHTKSAHESLRTPTERRRMAKSAILGIDRSRGSRPRRTRGATDGREGAGARAEDAPTGQAEADLAARGQRKRRCSPEGQGKEKRPKRQAVSPRGGGEGQDSAGVKEPDDVVGSDVEVGDEAEA